MNTWATLSGDEIARLQQTSYNATVFAINEVHEDLRIIRVRPDEASPSYSPGQYCVLGLGNWEPRVAHCQDEQLDEGQVTKLLKRAYSFSCPMLDAAGALLPPSRCDFLEFYIVLVRRGDRHPPGLTPRLFALDLGDRLFVGAKATGRYTLTGVHPADNVVLVATGTGEAPHNAMVAELMQQGHRGRVVCVTCVRQRRDLGYQHVHRELQQRYANYLYLTLTTREPENLDLRAAGYVGKQYLQDYFSSGQFERAARLTLDPTTTHVFLCGNPAMIGAPQPGADSNGRPRAATGMVEVLEKRGFKVDLPREPGNLHFEKYW